MHDLSANCDCLGYGDPHAVIDIPAQEALISQAIEHWGGPPRRLLILPPDITRFHSGAGTLTSMLYVQLCGKSEIDIMPTLGTHRPMDEAELLHMFPGIPLDRFHVHDWRRDVLDLGEIPANVILELSDHRLDFPVRIQLNRRLIEGDYDLVVSIGQVVPHEVIGMANHNKNILVGLGGSDLISSSHYLGAVCGMEQIMGRIETPVRSLMNYAERQTLAGFPIQYLQTVVSRDLAAGGLAMRGIYIGKGKAPFIAAAQLSQRVNLTLLKQPVRKAVVWLDPGEFKSTWLGNKAIYRLRMAMADEGELIILAPGVRSFGEDRRIDELIRQHGYGGTQHILEQLRHHEALRTNLAAAAHLIHGSSEGRFRIVYAAGGLSCEELERVGYDSAPLERMLAVYAPDQHPDGYHRIHGEDVFYVNNPALGLWALDRDFDT